MIRKTIVTLEVAYDDDLGSHPARWDWDELINVCDGESVKVTKTEDVDEHELLAE